MRPPRLAIVAALCVTFAFILVSSSRSSTSEQKLSRSSSEQKAGIRRLLSFQTPFSLFPPNAIISLTDDNTTSFLASPAGFGPALPAKGLSGQIWIGSGFGDDSLRQGTVTAGAEGELGCSDVPGWVGGSVKAGLEGGDLGINPGKSQNQRRTGSGGNDRTAASDQRQTSNSLDTKRPPVDDGTDDYLHHPLPGSPFVLPLKPGQVAHDGKLDGKNNNHADIQSIQEGAEIAGKVVILSRGGCGFLEKVKWVQRRGGIALIVGDDTRGGPLIQMYARGDTSNVTIPSVFTSHTTAHLLSSLIPPGTFIQDTIDENGKVSLKVQQSNNPTKKSGKAKSHGSQPTFTPTTVIPKATSPPKPAKSSKKIPTAQEPKPSPVEAKQKSWLKSIFGRPQSGSSGSEDSRPPSSGRLDWVLVDNWDDDEGKNSNQQNKQKNEQTKSTSNDVAKSKSSQSDDFVIGVQDWRDPDLVGSSKDTSKDTDEKGKKVGKTTTTKTTIASSKQTPTSGKKQAGENLEGGSITPGSGEYGSEAVVSERKSQDIKGDVDKKTSENLATSGILSKLFGDDDEDELYVKSSGSQIGTNKASQRIPDEIFEDLEIDHEGLWVTLTPTSGASPFFDTLLVLVVSPLVTLTVVYALLLLRSRIRRRRWRAPKSVVERLPVRTFQTHVSSTSSSPRLPSSPATSSPTTPLLQASSNRPRPRSRTTSCAPADLVPSPSDPRQVPSRPDRAPEHEKGASVTSQWSKFMGKQVECVVCLEEYIDGVSRVMSLPCGHEFHEACITPWLTTRRRTCPICKGDVVRSLARGSPSGSPSRPRYDAYHDESDTSSVDIQTQAAETVNESPTSAMPITSDLESGISSPTRTRRGARRGASWRSLLATSLGGSSRNPDERRNGTNDRSR